MTNTIEYGGAGFFRAKFRKTNGEIAVHDYFLPSAREVRREIIAQGYAVLSIRYQHHGEWWQREWYSLEHKMELLRAISFYVETGKSASEALKIVLESEENPRKRADYKDALEILKRGGGFTTAIEALRMFDRVILMLLQAGEVFNLRVVIESAVTLMQSKAKIKAMTRSFASFLGMEVVTAISTVWAIKDYALPFLKESGISSQDPMALKMFTEKVDLATTVINSIWFGSLAAIMLVLLTIVVYSASPSAQILIERLLSRVRWFRGALVDGEMGETFGIISKMIQAGVPFITAVRTLNNVRLQVMVQHYWARVEQRSVSGMPLAAALDDTVALSRPELVALRALQDEAQLGRLLDVMAAKRVESAQRNRLRVINWGAYATIGYIIGIVLVAVWMLTIQDYGQAESMKSIMKG